MVSTSTSNGTVHRTAASALRAGALIGATAVAGNLLVYAIARAIDVNLEVTQPNSDSSQVVGLPEVVVMTLGPLVLGTLLLVAVARWRPGGWLPVAWFGLAVGVLTMPMPLSADAEAAAKVTLASMHLIAGVAWFAILLTRDRRN